MKSTLIMLAFFAHSIATWAQEDVFSNKTNMALEKVIKDFPNRFHNIKGEMIVQRAQTTEYRSTIQVPGTSSCTVIKHAVSNNDVYSWNCSVFATRDFNLAKNKFKEIFDQIENTIIKIDGQKPFIMSGQYRTPQEERKYTNVVFEILPAVGDMQKLKVELTMQYIGSEWKVFLTVYDSSFKEDITTAVTSS